MKHKFSLFKKKGKSNERYGKKTNQFSSTPCCFVLPHRQTQSLTKYWLFKASY